MSRWSQAGQVYRVENRFEEETVKASSRSETCRTLPGPMDTSSETSVFAQLGRGRVALASAIDEDCRSPDGSARTASIAGAAFGAISRRVGWLLRPG